MSIESNVATARRWHQDVYVGGRYEVASEICADDLIAHGTGVPDDAPHGPRFLEADAAEMRSAFRIDTMSDDDVIVSGDRVVIRWTFRGEQVAPVGGIAPTGRPVTVEGIDIFRLANGRIAEFWGYYDPGQLLPSMSVA